MTAHWPSDWDIRLLSIADDVLAAFPRFPVPAPEIVANLNQLHEGELKGILGKDWLEVFFARKSALHADDWHLLTKRGFFYYGPAFFLSSLSRERNWDPVFLIEFFLKVGSDFMGSANAPQQRVLCDLMNELSRSPGLKIVDYDESDLPLMVPERDQLPWRLAEFRKSHCLDEHS